MNFRVEWWDRNGDHVRWVIKAVADHAVCDDESFEDWCRAEYQWYLRDRDDYEVPYTGLFD